MNKVYSRINWENEPSTKTPLNEHNLNKIDFAVDEIDNRVIELDSTKAKNTDLQTLSTRVDNLILNAGDSSAECTDARVTEDGTTYDTLKKRLDAEHSSVIEDISQLSDENAELKSDIVNSQYKKGTLSGDNLTITTQDAYGLKIAPNVSGKWWGAITTSNVILDKRTGSTTIIIGNSDDKWLGLSKDGTSLYELSKTTASFNGIASNPISSGSTTHYRFTNESNLVIIDGYYNGEWRNIGNIDITQYGNYTYAFGQTGTNTNIVNVTYYEYDCTNTEIFYPSNKGLRYNVNNKSLNVTNAINTSWWSVFKKKGLLIFDRWSSQCAIGIDDDYIYSIALSGGAMGYIFKLSRTSTNFQQTSTKYDFLTQDVRKMFKIENNKVVVYEFINTWIKKGYISLENTITPIIGVVHNTVTTFNYSFENEITVVDSDNAFNTIYNYPYLNKIMYILGDSQSDYGWYIPYIKDTLKLNKTQNFSASGNPIQYISSEESFYSRHNQIIEYATENNETPSIILINGGTNDFGRSLPIGTPTSTENNTLYGALDKIVSDYVTAFPTCTIVLVAPAQRNSTSSQYSPSGNGPNDLGLYLKEYVECIKTIGERYSCKVVDLYTYGGINQVNARNSSVTFNGDGLHYSPSYAKHIAAIISKNIL